MKLKPLIKEAARDTIAIGGIAMFILVLARSSTGQYFHITYQIILAGLILFILSIFIKSENHIARAIILYIFTILFYNKTIYTSFATIVLILITASLVYLKYPKKQIILGALLGLISSGISYFVFNNLITSVRNF